MEEAYEDSPCHSDRSRSLVHQQCSAAVEAAFLVGGDRCQPCRSDEALIILQFRDAEVISKLELLSRYKESDEYETAQRPKIEMYLGS